MIGRAEHEMEMGVPATMTWDLYGTTKLGELIEKKMSDVFHKVELVEGTGDGGLGSVFIKTLNADRLGISYFKEKVTKMDCENRITEKEIIEGGYLEAGFTLFRIRFEVIEKGEESSIIKTTLEYELKDEATANASLVSYIIQEADNVAKLAKTHLNKN